MCDVLVLDDDPLILSTLAEALRDEGFTVEEARTAQDALDRLQTEPLPGILVTDIDLGTVLNGHDVVQRALQVAPDLPVIFITGQLETRQKHQPAQNERVVLKPFMPKTLVTLIREMCP